MTITPPKIKTIPQYIEGQEAFAEGKLSAENPHVGTGTGMSAHWWICGWLDALRAKADE